MTRTRLYSAVGIALAQALTIVPAAKAQLEEVIVTAERREASLQDTDISMAVFSTRSIEEQGIQNYLDLSALAPNVLMHEMPGKAGGAIAIRGFKNAETFATFEPKVALYLDGVLLAKGAGSVFDILDLERVEILRGPQGTLYGRNTVGGAVNFITKKPSTEEFYGKVSATFGNYNQRDLRGMLNIPLGDTLAFKANLGTLNRDGYWENALDGETLGDKDRETAHLQFMWDPTDNLNVLYSYDQTDIDEGFYPGATVNYGPLAPQLAPWVQDGTEDRYFDAQDTYTKADIEGHGLNINWAITDSLSLVSITGLREFKVESFQDSDATPVLQGHVTSGDDYENLTQEFRLVGEALNSSLEYVLGAFYMDEDIKDTYQNLDTTGIAGGLSIRSGAEAKNEVWAVFGEGTYSLTEKLDLTFGLRYTEEDRSMTNRSSNVLFSGTVLSDVTNPDGQLDFEDVSGTVSASYNWTHDLMTYFKVSKGYSSGGLNARQPNPELFYPGYDEETVITYELGWKTTWLDNRLLANGAIFYNDYSDLQVNQLTESGSNNIDNAGDAEITGLELEVTAVITDNFEIGGGYGYLDPEYNTYINEGVPGDPTDDVDLSKNHFAHSPENTFNIYGRYEVEEVFGGNLVMRVDYSWVDDYFLLTANGPDLVDGNAAPSYETLNARIALNDLPGPGDTRLTFAAWGKNLTDDLWYNSGFDLSDGPLGYVGKSPSAPMTFGMDIILDF